MPYGFNDPPPGYPTGGNNLPYYYPQDAGSSCSNPDPGDGGYCYATQTGALPGPGPSVGYNGGAVIYNGVSAKPNCTPEN